MAPNKILIIIYILSLLISLINCSDGSSSNCSDKYCLYMVDDLKNSGNLTLDENSCSGKSNNRNGWLLEVYDEDVQLLVDGFIEKNNLKNKNFLLGTKMNRSGWMWINNNQYSGNVDDQSLNGFNSVAYMSNTNVGSNLQTDLRYVADVPTKKHEVLCSISNPTNCSRSNSSLYQGICYFIINELYTWYDGEMECRKLGGSLAILGGGSSMKDIWRTFMFYMKWVPGYPNNSLHNSCIAVGSYNKTENVKNGLTNYNCSSTEFHYICMEDNKPMVDGKRVGLGAGLGLSLLLLLLALIVFLYVSKKKTVFCFAPFYQPPWKRKKLTKPRANNDNNNNNINIIYAEPVKLKKTSNKSDNDESSDNVYPPLQYVELQFDSNNNNISNNNNNISNNNHNNNDDIYYNNENTVNRNNINNISSHGDSSMNANNINNNNNDY
ncbi:hypothetical protein HELRODRAFT_179739 [Helobdella robusta]|uniref:C-type lectin domain-containing protein n=1 Tax=Helobdella robusta TaxID=6412 RepID=T1FF36_HELRO|nr:hypothetical protein HELRODRAFT_179739 [Helobdella robusta]ESN95143.1 hypothetical protein HELRODRAFT_179739 [Helobdella robusta]